MGLRKRKTRRVAGCQMSPEDIGLVALIRPFVIVGLLWIVYKLVRIGARRLPPGELRDICNLTLDNANRRAEENQRRQE